VAMPPSGEVRMVLRITSEPRTENDMSTDNSNACRVIGYSRQQFYEIRRNFQTYGADGLREEGGAWPPPPPTAPGKPGTAAVVPVFELRILQSAAMHRTLQFPSCLVIGVKVNFVGAARSLCETMWSPIPI
jgi:hypothetical protein